MSSWGHVFRLVLVAGCAAAAISLAWFVGQQQLELAEARAELLMPAELSLSLTPPSAGSSVSCERIFNHSGRMLVFELSYPQARPARRTIAPGATMGVCFDAGGYSVGP